MHIRLPKATLLDVLEKVAPYAPKKSPNPMLSQVHMHADGGKLHLYATDLYQGIHVEIGAGVIKGGRMSTDAEPLLKRVAQMPAGDVELESDGGGIQAKLWTPGAKRRFAMPCSTGQDMPTLPKVPAEENGCLGITMPLSVLAERIAETYACISDDEARPHVNSGLWSWSKVMRAFRMVATDGHRLALSEAKGVDGAVTGDESVLRDHTGAHVALVPKKAIAMIKRALDAAKRTDSEIAVTLTRAHVFLDIDAARIFVKLVDAQFPPYEGIIPKAADAPMRAPRKVLAEAIGAVRFASDDKHGRVILDMTNSQIAVTAESPENGSAYDHVMVDGEAKIAAGFNAKYALEVLAAAGADDVIIHPPATELDPMRIDVPRSDGQTTYILMPMKL